MKPKKTLHAFKLFIWSGRLMDFPPLSVIHLYLTNIRTSEKAKTVLEWTTVTPWTNWSENPFEAQGQCQC